MDPSKISNLVKIAIQAAKDAGEEVARIYRTQDVEVSKKGDSSIVTNADIASDKIILEKLKETNIMVLSEESEDNLARLDQDLIWVVDSLDGTRDFVDMTGEFCLMIGLVQSGKPLLGVVYQPVEEKLYFASRGHGAYLRYQGQEEKLLISKNKKEAKLCDLRAVMSRNHFSQRDQKLLKDMSIDKILNYGSNGLKIGLIAENKAEIFFNTTDKMSEWDACAPHIIVEESGGTITDIRGEDVTYNNKNTKLKWGLVASHGGIHTEVIDIINSSKESR